MEISEATTIVANLQKTKDTKTLIQLLEVLKEKVVPTEKFLRKTKVGIAVNRLRSNSDPAVSALVKTIIKSWKDEVFKEKRKKHQKQAAQSHASEDKSVKVESVKNEENNEQKSKEKFVSTRRRNPANDGVKINFYDNSTRNGCISGLYTALAIGSTAQPDDIVGVAKEVEKCAFEMHKGKIDDKYRNKTRSLIMNLRNKKNPELREKILSRELKASRFVYMTNQELAPESLKKEMADMHQKNLFEAQGAVQKRAVTDRFVCARCKQREVSYYQMQTRSADEPLTTFCTCEKCGYRWKFC